MARYLKLADAVALHHRMMRAMGMQSQGLRDEGALESAIMRARMAAHHEGADAVRQGTLIAIGIWQAQAFVDGNKRTAFLALDTFLTANDFDYAGDPLELAKQLERVAERSSERGAATDEFEAWVRERVEARSR